MCENVKSIFETKIPTIFMRILKREALFSTSQYSEFEKCGCVVPLSIPPNHTINMEIFTVNLCISHHLFIEKKPSRLSRAVVALSTS